MDFAWGMKSVRQLLCAVLGLSRQARKQTKQAGIEYTYTCAYHAGRQAGRQAHACMHAYIHDHTHASTYIHTHEDIQTCRYTYMRTYIRAFMYACVSTLIPLIDLRINRRCGTERNLNPSSLKT